MARARRPYRGNRGSEGGGGIDLGSMTRTEDWVPRTAWSPAQSAVLITQSWLWLPRKEVIQPQLPLRLPCYDFVPVTAPTLGACLPCGLARRLQVLPTSMT